MKVVIIFAEIGLDLKDTRCIKELYMRQMLRVKFEDIKSEFTKLKKGVRQKCCMSPILYIWV